MYEDFDAISSYYDELYVDEPAYAQEAARVKELLSRHGVPAQGELLVLACGTGGHLPYFMNEFRVAGLDLSEAMLDQARRKFPAVPFHQGNLIDFRLERRFDATVCLYGSIGFVRTVANLRAAMARIAAHLRPGGAAVVTPWSTAETFQEMLVVGAVDRPARKIACMEQIRLKAPGLVEVTFHHLLGSDGEVAYHKQAVEIGLFSREAYRSAMTDAGLEVVEEVGEGDIRGGAFVGRRR
jgi:SAM-dependent methyltransferase